MFHFIITLFTVDLSNNTEFHCLYTGIFDFSSSDRVAHMSDNQGFPKVYFL